MTRKKSTYLALLAVLLAPMAANADPIEYAGPTPSVSNCIPFGCPDNFDPHMGFVYQDIAAFTLNPGDTIAFDTGLPNDVALSFDLSLASTTVNGGYVVDSNGFTTVSSLGANFFGDDIVGNYDIIFVANTTFNFLGGGLIVDFFNTGGVDNFGEQNLVYSLDNPYSVRRYFNGAFVGDMSRASLDDGRLIVGNMRIDVAAVPEPGTLALLGIGLLGIGAARRRRKA